MDTAEWVQGYLEEVAESPEMDAKFRERLDLVRQSQMDGSLKVYIQKAFTNIRGKREEAAAEAKKADQAVEQSENAVIKAMGKKKVTEQAMKQMKEKFETLRQEAEKQRNAVHQQRLHAWRIGGNKKRHRPKELVPLYRELATSETGVQGG